jgi:hypothetical protein
MPQLMLHRMHALGCQPACRFTTPSTRPDPAQSVASLSNADDTRPHGAVIDSPACRG